METIIAGRGMKAGDILDMAFDMGLERPKIATAGEWDGGRVHILTYGPLAYRKTMEIHSPAMRSHVEQRLREALAPEPIIQAVIPADTTIPQTSEGMEIISQPITLTKPKAKRVNKAAH